MEQREIKFIEENVIFVENIIKDKENIIVVNLAVEKYGDFKKE